MSISLKADAGGLVGSIQIGGVDRVIVGSQGIQQGDRFSFRNKLINGNFDIWQRATSQTSSGYGSVDRWIMFNTGSTKTASRQTFALGQTDVPNNPKFFCRTVVTSVAGAGNFVNMSQRIESVLTLATKAATVSFWAKADASKNIAIDFQQFFGTGGSPSTAVQVAQFTAALTTSWQKFTFSATIPNLSGKTLGTDGNDFLVCRFWFDAGSDFNSFTNSLGQQSGTFDIAQVQLEEGTAATQFEQRPLGLELSLCQRYYQVINQLVVSNDLTNWRSSWSFLTQMRVVPTISTTGAGGATFAAGEAGFHQTTNASGVSGFIANFDAEI